jgi:putative endonuclease
MGKYLPPSRPVHHFFAPVGVKLHIRLKDGTIIPKMPIGKNWRITLLERSMAALEHLAQRRGRLPIRAEHLETGQRGEDAVFFHLLRSGFTVVARRWNDGPLPGDLDLIAWQDDVLCFIEVKTRSSKDVAPASLAVDRNKRKTLRRLAGQYLRQLPEEERPETRFDIVTVYELPGQPSQIQLIPAAFSWNERHES